MEPGRLWALAMNTTRARILRDVAAPGPPELVMRAEHRRLQGLVGAAAQPPAIAEADPLAADRRDFVVQVIQLLETHRLASDFDRLALFAAPALLGELRAGMPARLDATVVARVPRTLVEMPGDALLDAMRSELDV
ncbi:Protein required for attachment to host cells [Rhodovulum sp. ES.010]|nr:Protein required for attachment to host cells [Rhodovulum sp. ES.010]